MSRYPSDEELYRFIEELEKEELYAPRHLKEEILLKVDGEEKAEKSKNRKGQPTPFPVYTIKMAAGIAAGNLSDLYGSGSGREECEQSRFPRKVGAGEGRGRNQPK